MTEDYQYVEHRDGIHPSMLEFNKKYPFKPNSGPIIFLFNKTFKIPYWIRDNGDGSASLVVEKTLDVAAEKAEEQRENGSGFCDAYGELEVKLDNNNILCNGETIMH